MHYIFDLVMKINEGIDSYEDDEDEVVVEYESMKEATEVLDRLREKLYSLHPVLIGDPEGVFMDDEDDVLYFKNCEIWVWER